MTRRTAAAAVAALVAAAVAAPAATAATPETGYVDAEKVKQNWSGEAYGQPFKERFLQNETFCIAPFCDAFTLDVRSEGDLQLRMIAPGSAVYVDVEVTLPDGTVEFFQGNDSDVTQVIEYEDAQLGEYTIRIWPNELIGLYDGQYSGRATLTPPPDPEPAPEG